MKKFFLLGVLTFLLTACSDNVATITPEEFNELEKGMTVEEVNNIVGGKAEKIEKIEGIDGENHTFNGEDGLEEDPSVILFFSKGKLDVLTEIGLITEDNVIKEVTEAPTESYDLADEAEKNAKVNPAEAGAMLYDKNEEKFKGMQYYFKGELIKTESVNGLFDNPSGALIVKNKEGYIMPIFPPYEIEVAEGDQIEVWGPLSGDGYSSSDLGVDNVVGIAGAINAVQIDINGERQ